MRNVISVGTLCALMLVTACDNDVGIAGPGEPFRFGGAGTGPGTVNTAVVGTWTRTVVFVDEQGIPRENETTWAFNQDGTAVRTIISRNVAAGISERQDALANWQVVNAEIVVDWLAPFTGRLRLAFIREGDQLILAGQTFFRAF
ncbi:MAG TPA: hypothetical protein VJ717_04870 [Gemmatimonadaceae bacterium]|nr:hypothetical protein [Gemmatimonadaceae bacterium]